MTTISKNFVQQVDPHGVQHMLQAFHDNFDRVKTASEIVGYLVGIAGFSGALSQTFVEAVENVAKRLEQTEKALEEQKAVCKRWEAEVNHTRQSNDKLFQTAVERARKISQLEAELSNLKSVMAERQVAEKQGASVKYGSLHQDYRSGDVLTPAIITPEKLVPAPKQQVDHSGATVSIYTKRPSFSRIF